MTAPLVSVVMPVYNAEPYLAAAVRSLLDQTFGDFELIAIDDGSTDGSLAVLRAFDDPRLVVVSQHNQGVSATLNAGLALARGVYVARHDADDLSLPSRLARQVEVMEADPRLGLLGSNYQIIDERDRVLDVTKVFCHPEDVRLAMVLSNQYGHGSVMIRASVLAAVGGYEGMSGYPRSFVEDADLWMRLGQMSPIANLPEPLYLWRRHQASVGRSNDDMQVEQAFILRDREFARFRAARPSLLSLVACFHPRVFRGGLRAYLEKKSTLFRDLAYLYLREGEVSTALTMQVVALGHAPWRRRNWRCLCWIVRQRAIPTAWTYEFV